MLRKILIIFFACQFSVFCYANESLLVLEKNDLLSPFQKPNQKYFLIGAGLAISLLAFEDQISDPAQSEVANDKPLGKFSVVGDYYGRLIPNLLYILGMGVDGIATKNEQSRKRAELMIRATSSAMLTTFALKEVVREPRPNNPEDHGSFPSGHTAAAFSFASVIGAEHGPVLGAIAYGLASLTALSRMNDNKHELHDVVAGAIIGTSYGLSIANRMKNSNQNEKQAIAIVTPSDDLNGMLLSFYSEF